MNKDTVFITGTRRKILVVLLALTIVFTTMIPSSNDEAYAADGTISLKVGRTINYSGFFTHYFYAGDKDNPVFCAQPQLPAPSGGTYSYSFLSPTSMLAKCLYYGLGGPGYEAYTDKQLSGSWDGEDDAYALTHIVISIAYDRTTTADVDPFAGLDSTWKAKAQALYNYISTLPAPPANYRSYIIRNGGCQDILGSFNDTGSIKIVKSSRDKTMTDNNSCYSLAGAKYGVYYGSRLIGTITTDANGAGTLDNVLVANYTIKEISASKGYAIDASSYNCSVKNETTTTVSVTEQPKDDPIAILLEKGDGETDKATPQGGAKLENAVYEIKYYKHTASGKVLDRTWRVKTGANGIAHLSDTDLDKTFDNSPFFYSAAGDPCFPLGTVTVQEVKAPEGYLLNSKIYTTEITEGTGIVESVYTYNTPKIGSADEVAEQPKRGDIKFVKVKDGTMQRLANVQFKITSKTTGESHIVCTDENGMVDTSSSFNSHKTDTNEGTFESGLWFGEPSAVDDEKGALLYDWYTLDEIRGESNEGLKLAKDVEFRVYRDSAVVDLGTVTDDVVKIKTTALDSDTKNHISLADNKVTIIDTVEYRNFTEGKKYKMQGTLMDRETGKAVEVDGKKVTVEKEFTCRDENGTIEMEFTFDATKLGGTDVVVFEKAYDVEAKEVITTHEDINDDNQRVTIPKIGTKAIGESSGTNVISYQGKQTIIDTISFENLLPGQKYVAKTWLVDANGNKISGINPVETSFTAETPDGTVDVKITFDAVDLAGNKVVVFEEISLDGKVVGEHKDVNDNNQTVTVTSPPNQDTPKTGDGTNMKPFIAIALAALLLTACLAIETSRKKKNSDIDEADNDTEEEEE